MATTAWRDLALDANGDLLIAGGDVALLQGVDAIAQNCKTALLLYAGEAPFDVTLGVDWPALFTKGPAAATNARVVAEVSRVLAGVLGVAAVDSVVVDRDRATRAATIRCTIRTDAGATATVVVGV